MLNLTSLSKQILAPGTKGLAISNAILQDEIGQQNWCVLHGDTSFPVAILKNSALQHNLNWMRQFCKDKHILLAPHGKTTMSPQIFDMQLRNGAWGMTLANVTQMQIAYRFGVKRVFLANQIINPADIRNALQMLIEDSEFTFYAITDSQQHIALLAHLARQAGLTRPLPLLVELGFAGGRTGCRSMDEALALARSIHANPHLRLAGIEGYEGLLVSHNRSADLALVAEFLKQLQQLTASADREQLFSGPEILISAGGSAYFDLVANDLGCESKLSLPVTAILRSGCYVTHDHGFYHDLIDDMQQREPVALQPALEIWSMVQSRPEPDLAILTMGKRDASYDIDLPLPIYTHRIGATTAPQRMPAACRIEKMNDQHAYLRIPADDSLCADLQVGDLVACGISHPCTTFDKWPLILLTDDAYRVTSAINTFF